VQAVDHDAAWVGGGGGGGGQGAGWCGPRAGARCRSGRGQRGSGAVPFKDRRAHDAAHTTRPHAPPPHQKQPRLGISLGVVCTGGAPRTLGAARSGTVAPLFRPRRGDAWDTRTGTAGRHIHASIRTARNRTHFDRSLTSQSSCAGGAQSSLGIGCQQGAAPHALRRPQSPCAILLFIIAPTRSLSWTTPRGRTRTHHTARHTHNRHAHRGPADAHRGTQGSALAATSGRPPPQSYPLPSPSGQPATRLAPTRDVFVARHVAQLLRVRGVVVVVLVVEVTHRDHLGVSGEGWVG
jgi:hypothetical protein